MPADLTPRDLFSLVTDKITALGDSAAQEYFGVSHGTIVAWRKGKTPPSLAAAQKCWDDSPVCQTPEVWGVAANKAEIMVLLPIYEQVEPLFMVTLHRSIKNYGIEKVSIIPRLKTLIDESRNYLVDRFLLTNAEWCIFADADGVLPCGNGNMLRKEGYDVVEPKASYNALTRIMSHPKEYTIVGALYKDRRHGIKVQCETAFRSESENKRLLGFFDGTTRSEGLEETGWVGHQLVRWHRSVFMDMKAAAVKGGVLEDMMPPPGREGEPLGYFGRTSRWRGEDVAACRRAAMAGHRTYIDTGLCVGHCGRAVY